MTSMVDIMADWEKNQKARRKECAAAKLSVMNILRDHGIKYVLVEYNGYGDSGQIETITAYGLGCPDAPEDTYTHRDHVMDFPDAKVTLPDGDDAQSIEEMIEDFAWNLIQGYHAGFENNEGGQGSIVFDTTDDTILYEHGDNVVEVHSTTHEL